MINTTQFQSQLYLLINATHFFLCLVTSTIVLWITYDILLDMCSQKLPNQPREVVAQFFFNPSMGSYNQTSKSQCQSILIFPTNQIVVYEQLQFLSRWCGFYDNYSWGHKWQGGCCVDICLTLLTLHIKSCHLD